MGTITDSNVTGTFTAAAVRNTCAKANSNAAICLSAGIFTDSNCIGTGSTVIVIVVAICRVYSKVMRFISINGIG